MSLRKLTTASLKSLDHRSDSFNRAKSHISSVYNIRGPQSSLNIKPGSDIVTQRSKGTRQLKILNKKESTDLVKDPYSDLNMKYLPDLSHMGQDVKSHTLDNKLMNKNRKT